jgi:spermidine/putrescine transport system substrate-binding protein
MNFYYEPEIAARLSAYERFICPVLGTRAAMREIDPALTAEQYIFPSAELLASAHYFRLLPPAVATSYNSRFATVLGL